MTKSDKCRVRGTRLHFGLVGLLGVEAETLPWACPAGTPRPLLGGGFADGGNQQGLHADTRVIHLAGRRRRTVSKYPYSLTHRGG